ncbi:MAG: MFS transporter [Christensenellales bacterium]|jgi:MFS family permease
MDAQKMIRRNSIFMVLEGALFFAGLSFIPSETIVADFIDFTTGSVALVGLAATIGSFAFYIGQFVCGLFLHRVERQAPFMIKMAFLSRSILLLFAVAMLLGLNGALAAWLFIICYGLIFIIDGFVGLIWMQICARTLPIRRRGEVITLQQSLCGGIAIFVGFILQRILTSAMPRMDRFTLIFLLGGAVLLFSATMMLMFKDVPHPSSPDVPVKNPIQYLRELAPLFTRDRGVRQTVFARILFTLTMISAPINYKFGQVHGLSEYQLSMLVYMPFIGQIVAGVFWSRVSRRTNYPTMMLWSQISGMLGAAANLVALGCAIAGVSVMPALCAAMILIKFTYVAGSAYSQHVIAIVDEEKRADHVVLLSILTAPAAFGTTLAGALANWAFWPVYAIMLASGLIGAVQTHHFFLSKNSPLPASQRAH